MPVIPRTFVERKEDVRPRWFHVDGDKQIVGRLATQIATILMGKHKASYTPHVDDGDYVIVTNVERIRFTGNGVAHDEHPYLTTKMMNKTYEHYTGYPSGKKVQTALEVWQKAPDRILQEAVRRMLPKNKLGRHMLKKLKMFVGPDHPHQAQQPEDFPQHLMP